MMDRRVSIRQNVELFRVVVGTEIVYQRTVLQFIYQQQHGHQQMSMAELGLSFTYVLSTQKCMHDSIIQMTRYHYYCYAS